MKSLVLDSWGRPRAAWLLRAVVGSMGVVLGCSGGEPFYGKLSSDGAPLSQPDGGGGPLGGTGGTIDEGSGGSPAIGTGGFTGSGGSTGSGGTIGSGGSGSGGSIGSGGTSGTGGTSGSGGATGSGGGNGADGSADMTVDVSGGGGKGGASGSGGAPGTGGASGGLCAGVAEWSAAAAPSYSPGLNGQPGTKVKHGTPPRLFRCKPSPEGFWCREAAYEPLAPSDYWRDAWDDLGACN